MIRIVLLLVLVAAALGNLPDAGSWRQRIQEIVRQNAKEAALKPRLPSLASDKQLFHQTTEIPIYTSSRISKHAGATPTFAFGTWMNKPPLARLSM